MGTDGNQGLYSLPFSQRSTVNVTGVGVLSLEEFGFCVSSRQKANNLPFIIRRELPNLQHTSVDLLGWPPFAWCPYLYKTRKRISSDHICL